MGRKALLALTFTGEVDPTALATFVLAVFTLASVLVGGAALRQNRDEVRLARQEVEEAHRPILVPVAEGATKYVLPTLQEVSAQPVLDGTYGLVWLAVRNIGAGPAANVVMTLIANDDAGDEDAAWGDKTYEGRTLVLGTSQVAPIEFIVPPGRFTLPSFDLTITYTDAGGQSWETTATWVDQGLGYYDALALRKPPRSQRPQAR